MDTQPQNAHSTETCLSTTETAVAALWCETLQISQRPGPSDNFFSLGGDSMTMTMLEFRIGEELGLTVPAGSLLNAQTLREFSALVEATRHTQSSLSHG